MKNGTTRRIGCLELHYLHGRVYIALHDQPEELCIDAADLADVKAFLEEALAGEDQDDGG